MVDEVSTMLEQCVLPSLNDNNGDDFLGITPDTFPEISSEDFTSIMNGEVPIPVLEVPAEVTHQTGEIDHSDEIVCDNPLCQNMFCLMFRLTSPDNYDEDDRTDMPLLSLSDTLLSPEPTSTNADDMPLLTAIEEEYVEPFSPSSVLVGSGENSVSVGSAGELQQTPAAAPPQPREIDPPTAEVAASAVVEPQTAATTVTAAVVVRKRRGCVRLRKEVQRLNSECA
jgi:hypothetical protein